MTDKQKRNSEEGNKKMIARTIRLDLELWNKARQKVGLFGSVSGVIRKFLHLWVEGKIDLDDYPDCED